MERNPWYRNFLDDQLNHFDLSHFKKTYLINVYILLSQACLFLPSSSFPYLFLFGPAYICIFIYLFIFPQWSARLKLLPWLNYSQIWNTSRLKLMRLNKTTQLTTPLSNFILVTNTLLVSITSSSVSQSCNCCEGNGQMRYTFIDWHWRVGFVLSWKQTTTSAFVDWRES